MHSEEDIHQSIVRLFEGEATPREKLLIDTWLKQSAENRKLFNDLNDIWLSSGMDQYAREFDVEQAIDRFRNRTADGILYGL